jgi:hypothetical protein
MVVVGQPTVGQDGALGVLLGPREVSGQAASAVATFQALSPADQQALLDFLGCI